MFATNIATLNCIHMYNLNSVHFIFRNMNNHCPWWMSKREASTDHFHVWLLTVFLLVRRSAAQQSHHRQRSELLTRFSLLHALAEHNQHTDFSLDPPSLGVFLWYWWQIERSDTALVSTGAQSPPAVSLAYFGTVLFCGRDERVSVVQTLNIV